MCDTLPEIVQTVFRQKPQRPPAVIGVVDDPGERQYGMGREYGQPENGQQREG